MDEKLTQQLLEGSTYEQATVNVGRTFPIGIDEKILTAGIALALAVPFAPLVYYRRELIADLEETESTTAALSVDIGTLAFAGIVSVFGTGLLFAYLRRRIRRADLDPERARRVVRIEDLLMWVLLQGTAFVLIAVAVATAGVLAPETVADLYQQDVQLYQRTGLALVDARLLSGVGSVLSAIMLVVWNVPDRVT
ncbi:hypothetical protein BRC62_03050 [Halobacteriales archaeon QH_10_67_13]|nr:MAG: hypothetical protein BRC62_03050 [Halobacteriales archaeon QH_10_67_13]